MTQLPETDYLHCGRIYKAANGREEYAGQALMNLLYLARTEKDCVSFDLYRSSFQINKSTIQDSFFFVKECWRNKEARDEFCKRSTLFEGEVYHVERIEVSGRISENTCGRVFSSVFMKAPDKEHESFKKELCERVQDWGEFLPGCLCCALYQGKDNENAFYIEQEWESTYAFNNATKDMCKIDAEIYIMDMASSPNKPISENAVAGDPQLIAGLRALNKDFGEFCVSASAIPWGKPLIDQKTKVFIALAIDVSEQITGKPFENHIIMARKQGVTREELEELLLFMSIYAGFNKAGVFYSELTRIFGPKEGVWGENVWM